MASTDAEVRNWVNKVEQAVRGFEKKDRKKILRRAGRPLRKSARSKIRDSKRWHKRYNTPKISKGKRAPQGEGRVAAVYWPGNLRRSISILEFRRSQSIFIGPKIGGKAGVKSYGKTGQPTDGYYANMVFGSTRGWVNRVVNPTVGDSGSAALAIVKEQAIKAIKEAAKRRGVNVK